MVETLEIPEPRIKPERLAWGVVLIAFAIFSTICALTTIGIYSFFFQSTVPMRVDLVVGVGSVAITESDLIPRVERAVRDLTSVVNVSVSTDQQSQGTLSFRIPDEDGRLLAAITVKRNTTLSLRSASLPRFSWSTSDYIIDLRDFRGEVDILVTERPDDNYFVLSVLSPTGAQIHIDTAGQYTLTSNDTLVQVVNRRGRAILFAPDLSINRAIPAGNRGTLILQTDEIILDSAFTDLLVNASFDTVYDAETTEQPRLPERWGCSNKQEDLPIGQWLPQVVDGRGVIRLLRNDNASSHGETLCVQYFAQDGQAGVDVTNFNFLNLRATMFINYQSLSRCGIRGSECPLMLRMDYIDRDGNPRQWFQGFYAFDSELYDYPPVCITCSPPQDVHQQINEQAWYTFETGNLFVKLADRLPGRILSITFYASGHQYDVYVGEVALLAGNVEAFTPPPAEITPTPPPPEDG